MIRPVFALALVGLIGGLSAIAYGFAQDFRDEVPSILKRAIDRGSTQKYVGTRVVRFRRGADLSEHTEYVTRDRSKLRIEFPSESKMAGQVIVENERERRHFFPESNEIHILPPRREEVMGRMGRLLRGGGRVQFAVQDGQTVAGKPTEMVMVADASGNVMQRIYVEPTTALVLKRELYDLVGSPVGGFEFRTIDLKPRIDGRLFKIARRGARTVTPATMLEELARKEGFRADLLPTTGDVRLEWSNVRTIDGESVLIQSYTSPEGRLTLFQMRRIVSPDRLGMLARGRVQFIYWRRDGRTFVLVGNRSQEDLRKLAAPITGGTTPTGG